MQEGNQGKSHLFCDLAITTFRMVKNVFLMLLRKLQGLMNSIFKLT
ncbi:transposase [Candidatus Enterovibrio altilux]